MQSFTDVSSGFAHLSLSLAEDARQAGDDVKACLFIELARSIFDFNERNNPMRKFKAARRRALAPAEA